MAKTSQENAEKDFGKIQSRIEIPSDLHIEILAIKQIKEKEGKKRITKPDLIIQLLREAAANY